MPLWPALHRSPSRQAGTVRRSALLLSLLVVVALAALGQFAYVAYWKPITFKLIDLRAETDTGDGKDFVRLYQSSDGESVGMSQRTLQSPEQAQESFDRLANLARTVLERSPLLGQGQSPAGERLEAIYPDGLYVIGRREGNRVRAVHAPTLRHAREFERQYFVPGRTGEK